MSFTTTIFVFLMTTGALWMFVAAVGLLRMPDLYLRISAAAKAGTLGVGSILAGVAIHFWELDLAGRAAAVVAFVFLTTPVAAHVLGLAAYRSGVPLWKETLHDELAGAAAEVVEEGTGAAQAGEEPSSDRPPGGRSSL